MNSVTERSAGHSLPCIRPCVSASSLCVVPPAPLWSSKQIRLDVRPEGVSGPQWRPEELRADLTEQLRVISARRPLCRAPRKSRRGESRSSGTPRDTGSRFCQTGRNQPCEGDGGGGGTHRAAHQRTEPGRHSGVEQEDVLERREAAPRSRNPGRLGAVLSAVLSPVLSSCRSCVVQGLTRERTAWGVTSRV